MGSEANFRFSEGKDPEENYWVTRQWLSELDFMKDEHQFYEDMLEKFTLPVIESNHFTEVKGHLEHLSRALKKREELEKRIKDHKTNQSNFLEKVAGAPKKEQIKSEHKKLARELHEFLKEYKEVKKGIFQSISQVMKDQKRDRLLP